MVVWTPKGSAFAPPDDFALPHVWTFSSVMSAAARAYWHDRFDEAVRHAREDALVMRNDCHLTRLLQERKLAVSSLNYHLEIPNERDANQVLVRDGLTAALKSTKGLRRIMRAALEAIWYGRYGVQVLWEWASLSGQRALRVRKWKPVNGDKIGHLHDGTPYVLIYSPAAQAIPGAEIAITTRGMSLVLRGDWRERFLIHVHEPDDMDFFDAEAAEAVFGVGVRSRLFWLDWIKREWLAHMSTFVQRAGLGVTVWYFEQGNPESQAQAETAAREQSDRVNIVWPRNPLSKSAGSGIERLEVPTGGAAFLLEAQKWVQELEELYVVGQTLSSKSEGSGLGGTGVADFHADTKIKIAAADAENLAETLTGDDDEPGLLSVMKKYTYPWADFPVTWKFDVEKSESKEKLDAAKTVVELGVPTKADEVRAAAGFSKPTAGDELVQPPQSSSMPPPGGGALPFDRPGQPDRYHSRPKKQRRRVRRYAQPAPQQDAPAPAPTPPVPIVVPPPAVHVQMPLPDPRGVQIGTRKIVRRDAEGKIIGVLERPVFRRPGVPKRRPDGATQ